MNRYRKMYRSNNEPQSFDFPLWEQTEEFLLPTQNEAIFNTDFGVTFATFTSYDILFYEIALHLTRKKNITDIVHPTLWQSETPFLTGDQDCDKIHILLLKLFYKNIYVGNKIIL